MKKLIIMIFTFVFLFIGSQSVLAAGPFNGQSGDCNPGMGIGIYPNNIPRDSYGCWSSTYIEAEPGDTINVAMYYHNNTSNTLNNVRGSIVKSTAGPANTFTFTGIMYSDMGSQTIGTVTLKLNSKQTLTYGSTHFMKDAAAVKSDIDTSVFHNDGGQMTVGSVPPGWNDYGEFLAVYKVSNTAPIEDTCSVSLTASHASIKQGENSLLTWNANGCTGTTIYPTLGNVDISGSQNVSPTTSTTYTLKGYNPSGVAKTDTVTINVDTTPVSICTASLTASTSSITLGGSSTLTWNTSNCTSATIYPTLGPVSTNGGSQPVSPTSDTTYTLTAYGTGGPVTKTVFINVGIPSSSCTASLTASTSSITLGGSSNLIWNTTNCTSATIYPTLGPVSTNGGSQPVSPTSDTTYTLTAYGTGGPVVKTVTIYVNSVVSECNINNFSASDYYLTRGERSTISWSLSNCDYATIYPTLGPVNSNGGSESVSPTSNTIYTLTARGRTGVEKVQTFQINVDTTVNNRCSITNFTASDTNISNGEYSTLRWNTDNCDSVKISYVGNVDESGTVRVRPASDTTYTLTAYNRDGTSEKDTVRIYVDEDNNDNNNYNTCYINSFTASNTYVTAGGNTRLNWSTQNCNYVSISTLGNVYASGSQIVTPYNNTNYILTAYGTNGGIVTRSVFVTVNQYVAPIPQPIPQPIYNACAVTTVATNVNQNSAQLNGIITGVTGGSSYFEYGTTINLGSRTNSRYSNSNITFYETVPNLAPNTIYFFRMVSDCNGGSSLGAIEVFRTLGIQQNNNVKQVIVQQGTTVIGTSSPIMLKISNKYELIGEGDLVDYIVNYKNIGKQLLTHPMVQVVLPTNITLVNSSRGTYSVDTHTLSAQVEDLRPGEEGVIFFQGKVDSIPLNNSQIATTAILIYTTPNGTQENAMAYVINVPKALAVVVGDGSNVLGGSAFFAGLLSLGFIGWLILILVILLIILIARSYSTRRVTQETTTHTTTTH